MAKQTSPLQPLPESLSLSLQPWPWHCHIVGAPFTETAVSGLHNLMTAPCFGGTWWGLSSNSFASALLPILSHISYPVLWISWGEGKCLLHLCRLLDIHRVTTDHSDIYLVSCFTELESPGCGWVLSAIFSLTEALLPLCSLRIFPASSQGVSATQVTSL